MKKYFKKFIGLALISVITVGTNTIAYAKNVYVSHSIQTEKPSVEVITDENKITEMLKQKGIYDKNKNVTALIEVKYPEIEQLQQSKEIKKEIYAIEDGSYSGTKFTPKYTFNYPAGSFHFSNSYQNGWQLTNDFGLKLKSIEMALGYKLNSSDTEQFKYDSPEYDYDFTVNAYVNYEEEYYKLYDKDIMFDDYIERAHVERETGYTLEITAQK